MGYLKGGSRKNENLYIILLFLQELVQIGPRVLWPSLRTKRGWLQKCDDGHKQLKDGIFSLAAISIVATGSDYSEFAPKLEFWLICSDFTPILGQNSDFEIRFFGKLFLTKLRILPILLQFLSSLLRFYSEFCPFLLRFLNFFTPILLQFLLFFTLILLRFLKTLILLPFLPFLLQFL